jgi:hypothetical protein
MSKKIFFIILFALFSLVAFGQRVIAQTVSLEGNSGQPQIISSQDVNFVNLTFDQNKIYNPGDKVSAFFTFVNNDPVDYTDVSLTVYLSVYSPSIKSEKVYGVENKVGSYFIDRNSRKKIDFEYKIPTSAVIPKDAIVKLGINVMQGTGDRFGGIGGGVIKVQGLSAKTDILSAYLKVGDKSYTLQEGPVVSSTSSPKLFIKISNLDDSAYNLTPVLKVYDLQPSKPEVLSKNYDLIVLSKKETKDIVLDLPIFNKPGVYAAELNFVDSNGTLRASPINTRWVVGGNICMVEGIKTDKKFPKKGEDINVEVSYIYASTNTATSTIDSSQKATIIITMYSGNQKVIFGKEEREISLNTLPLVESFQFNTKKDVNMLSALVVISKDGNELARYDALLSDPQAPITPPENNYIWISLGVILLLFLAFILKNIIKSRKAKNVVVIFVLTLTVFGFGVKNAYAVNIIGNISKEFFNPGADLSPFLTLTLVQPPFMTFYQTEAWYYIATSSNPVYKYIGTSNTGLIVAENVGDRLYIGFTPDTAGVTSTHFHVPNVQDSYKLKVVMDITSCVLALFCGHALDSTLIFDIIVKSQINGTCNNEVIDSCTSGTASTTANGISDTETKENWACIGAWDGSSDFTCSKDKPGINGLCNNEVIDSCTSGTASTTANGISDTDTADKWACLGSGWGTSDFTCSKNVIFPVCGTANNTVVIEKPTTNSSLCEIGILDEYVNGMNPYVWDCKNTDHPDVSVECKTNRPITDQPCSAFNGELCLGTNKWACVDGKWVSSISGTECSQYLTLVCKTLDGITIASGTSRTFYSSRISKSCDGKQAKCSNGVLIDVLSPTYLFSTSTYKYRSCVTPKPSEF